METSGSTGHPALTDPQTGLPNKLHWDTVFGIVFATGDRGIPITLVLLEMDDFSGWVDSRGPEGVENALASLGQILAPSTRQTDLVARINPECFSFFLMDCNLAGARLVADRLDAMLDPIRGSSGLKFSMGVAAHTRNMEQPQDLAKSAEEALRIAQSRGGDQIEFFG